MVQSGDEIQAASSNDAIDQNDTQRNGAGDGEIFGKATLSKPPNTNILTGLYRLLSCVLDGMEVIWSLLLRFLTFMVIQFYIYHLFDASVLWCVRNPKWALVVVIAEFVFFLPFLIVLCFTIATMILTFTGILVLEETLLILAFMLFCDCVSFLAFLVLLFAFFAVVFYLGFAYPYDFYGGLGRYRQLFMSYVKKQPQATSQETINPELQDGRHSAGNSDALLTQPCE